MDNRCCELGDELGTPSVGWIDAVHGDFGRASVADAVVCLHCGALRDHPGWRASHSNLMMLRGRIAVGRTGRWKTLLLPRFDEIGDTVGSRDAVQPTVKRRRFELAYESMSHGNIEGLVRKELGLPAYHWPYAVTARSWSCPVIIHDGLAGKFASKRDRPHLFLVSYTPDAIRYPTEVWLGDHRRKARLRFLKKLSTASSTHTLMVCVDPASSIVVSSYIVAPHACDASREGTLLEASWVAQ